MDTLPVFMSYGRWVAMCPRPGCYNAEQFGKCDDSSPGGLTGSSFTCRTTHGGCGLKAAVNWPPNVDDIEYLTRSRPIAARNWLPGESAEDLIKENVMHGLVPQYDMDILDGRLTVLREIEYPDAPIQDAEKF